MIELPESLDPYQVEAPLAHGGMAALWKAHHQSAPEHRVVLKMMLPHVARDEDCVAMFLREAALSARFSHPNIVSLLDVGVVAGQCFIELEYLAGRNLRQILRRALAARAQLPIPFALAAISDTADALAYIHDFSTSGGEPSGLVHRDVSPENVMVGFDGRARLLDFGVATLEHATRTRTGQIKGKLHYMAPEVFAGDGSGPARDVYAAGVTLYELLTGVRPFRGSDEAELMYAIAHRAPAPARDLRPDLSTEVEAMLLASLHRQPDARINAVELGERARSALAELEPDKTPSQVLTETVYRWFPAGDDEPEEAPTELRSIDIEPVYSEGRSQTSPLHQAGQRPGRPDVPPRVKRMREHPGENIRSVVSSRDIFLTGRHRLSEEARTSNIFARYTPPEEERRGSAPAESPPREPRPAEAGAQRDALWHFERGLEHRRRGRLDATLQEWELAAQLDPSNRTIATNVRLMKSKMKSKLRR